ncbi:hypothetical protein D9758_014924 [Tetrapyrgos nigripes]|uniref:Uncharacterized protein n=1 Tax=Tetrapyrgos nigripes TaxID=182062 RepID=A0A8H5C9J7_9AGAR|nr:hypothetical protein D9758_014924 [Tetrapyrgos nigripes]
MAGQPILPENINGTYYTSAIMTEREKAFSTASTFAVVSASDDDIKAGAQSDSDFEAKCVYHIPSSSKLVQPASDDTNDTSNDSTILTEANDFPHGSAQNNFNHGSAQNNFNRGSAQNNFNHGSAQNDFNHNSAQNNLVASPSVTRRTRDFVHGSGQNLAVVVPSHDSSSSVATNFNHGSAQNDFNHNSAQNNLVAPPSVTRRTRDFVHGSGQNPAVVVPSTDSFSSVATNFNHGSAQNSFNHNSAQNNFVAPPSVTRRTRDFVHGSGQNPAVDVPSPDSSSPVATTLDFVHNSGQNDIALGVGLSSTSPSSPTSSLQALDFDHGSSQNNGLIDPSSTSVSSGSLGLSETPKESIATAGWNSGSGQNIDSISIPEPSSQNPGVDVPSTSSSSSSPTATTLDFDHGSSQNNGLIDPSSTSVLSGSLGLDETPKESITAAGWNSGSSQNIDSISIPAVVSSLNKTSLTKTKRSREVGKIDTTSRSLKAVKTGPMSSPITARSARFHSALEN